MPHDQLGEMAKLIAVGLILALTWCRALLPSEAALERATPAADQWMGHYADVFGEIRKEIPPLSQEAIIEKLEIMRSTLDQVRDNKLIKEHMINTLNLWYSAIMDRNAAHCNLDYFNNLDNELNSILNMRVPPTNNKDQLLEMLYHNYGNFCRQILADSLTRSINDQTISDLKNISLAQESFAEGKISSTELAKRVFEQLESKKNSKKEIVESWSRGPCNQLQQVMNAPEKIDSYKLLVRTDVLRKKSGSYDHAQETVDFFFKMLRVCHELDRMITDLADEYKSSQSLLGRLFGKHA